jgi:hypothetical protein
MKIWNRNNLGKLINVVEVADMEEARQKAAQWNKHNAAGTWRIDVIANAEKTSEATKVCAVY